jgi:hypothetical protein
MEQGVLIYTTAPVDYDGHGTVTQGIYGLDGRGREIRIAHAKAVHASWQRQRYASGLHMAADTMKIGELERHGLILPYTERERALLAKAKTLPANTVTALQILYATSAPGLAPDGSDLAQFLAPNGRLSDEGKDLAAMVVLRDMECRAEGKAQALRWLTRRQVA